MKYKDALAYARSMRKNQTPAEKFFWEKVRGQRFMGLKFNRQFIIQHWEQMGHKAFFIPDFHCFEKQLLVEIDGGIHKEQVEYDRIREDILKEMGYHIIRFRNEEVLYDWDSVARKLEDFINEI